MIFWYLFLRRTEVCELNRQLVVIVSTSELIPTPRPDVKIKVTKIDIEHPHGPISNRPSPQVLLRGASNQPPSTDHVDFVTCALSSSSKNATDAAISRGSGNSRCKIQLTLSWSM
jgi:hypothetical protein